MLKTLIRKQLLEINKSFFYDYRRNRAKTKGRIVTSILLYLVLLVGVLGGMFTVMAGSMAGPLSEAGFDWLYFLIMDGVAIILGIFGSVFSSYSSLYLAKDNDFLLSMPIPVRHIMVARLLGVYLMDLMYTLVVLIPMCIMYWIAVPASVASIVGPIVLTVMTTLFVLVLSTGLGWVVARISLKMKNKSLATTFIALAGIGLYYFIYFKAVNIIQDFINNITSMEIKIEGAVKPLYFIGKTGAGETVPMLVVSAVVIVLTVAVYLILNRTFIKIVTTKTGASRTVYKGDSSKARSADKALLFRELKRFTSSSTYTLNCGMGALMMVLAAVFLLIKGTFVFGTISELFGGGEAVIPVVAGGIICAMMAMVDITAPSVSLEGKTIWISQSLPVSSMQILNAKLKTQLLISLPPAVLLAISEAIVLKLGIVDSILVVVLSIAAAIAQAQFGLFMNLKNPNLNWTSEMMVIKQGLGIFIALFAPMILGVVIIFSGIFLANAIGGTLLLGIWLVLTVVLAVLLDRWLRKRGTVIYESL
ncbi:MAG: hypothetical protein J5775_00865 [Spirochaetales bacterium]|nr:hypothetical protein [Spirochaetales bacterium]